MQATLLAIRAIGAEFARGLWVSSLVVALITGTALVAILIWLTSLSAWWWLLAIPIGIGLSVVTVLLIVFRLLIRYVRPEQTADQKKQIRNFIGKLQVISELSSTPKFIVLFRTIRSIAAPSSDHYLQELFETKNLRKDFQAITKTFKQ